MERWTGAFGEIRVRHFDEISNLVAAPIAFSFATYSCPLSSFIDVAWDEGKGANQIVEYANKVEDYATSSFAAYTKFMHVLDCARSQVNRGAFTWSIVDAYHASLMGARAILAHLGICVFSVKGRTVLVDIFPEYGSKGDKRRFARATRGCDSPIRIIAPTKDRLLEQGDLWKLVKRLFNLKSFFVSHEQLLQSRIVDLIEAKPWQSRHTVLYDLSAWRWPFDIGLAPRSTAAIDTLMLANDPEVYEFVDFIDNVFNLVKFYFDQLSVKSGVGPLTLPPGMVAIASPNVLN